MRAERTQGTLLELTRLNEKKSEMDLIAPLLVVSSRGARSKKSAVVKELCGVGWSKILLLLLLLCLMQETNCTNII